MRKLASFPRCRADLAATRNSEEIIEKIRIFILDAPLHLFRIIHDLGGFAMSKRHRLAGLIAAVVQAAPALAQSSYADPAGSGPIVNALHWLQGTLLGTVATVVAIIAVASVGFLMLTGRMNWRYGATVILGCFILFGAASIVGGIQAASSAGSGL
jgi:type IV secretory pathway VirB2 component (pilin)